MAQIIVILVIMVLINLGMIFAIIRLAKRTDDNLHKFFLDKAGDFFKDFNLQQNIEETPLEEEKETVLQDNSTSVYVLDENDVTKYKNNEFREEYKNIKEELDFDRSDVILDVIGENEDGDEDNAFKDAIISIANNFDFDTVYELSTVSSSDQLDILKEVFDENELQFLAHYVSSLEKEFSITDFLKYVKEQVPQVDDAYYVKTGWKDEDFDELDDKIITVHDDEIVEGIKVVHKNKIYDYSI